MNRSRQAADLLYALHGLTQNLQAWIGAEAVIEHNHIAPGREQRQPSGLTAALDALCCVNCLRRMKDLFQYVPGNSLIHRLNPITKILLTVAICVAAFMTDSLICLAVLLAIDPGIGLIAGVPKKTLDILKGLLKIAVFLFVLQALLARKRMRSCVLILRMILVFLFFQILLQIDEERRDPDDGSYEMHYKQSSIWNKILVNEVKYSYSSP